MSCSAGPARRCLPAWLMRCAFADPRFLILVRDTELCRQKLAHQGNHLPDNFGIDPISKVRRFRVAIGKGITETEKLAQWWTTDTRGSGAKLRDTLEFSFYGHRQKFIIEELKPGKRVAWKSPKGQGNSEWEERLKSCSICRRMRSRTSSSFGTWAGEKARTFRVIAS